MIFAIVRDATIVFSGKLTRNDAGIGRNSTETLCSGRDTPRPAHWSGRGGCRFRGEDVLGPVFWILVKTHQANLGGGHPRFIWYGDKKLAQEAKNLFMFLSTTSRTWFHSTLKFANIYFSDFFKFFLKDFVHKFETGLEPLQVPDRGLGVWKSSPVDCCCGKIGVPRVAIPKGCTSELVSALCVTETQSLFLSLWPPGFFSQIPF